MGFGVWSLVSARTPRTWRCSSRSGPLTRGARAPRPAPRTGCGARDGQVRLSTHRRFVQLEGAATDRDRDRGRFLTTTALGYYRYGLRIARVPVNAMIEIVAYALFPAFSRMADEPERMRGAYLRALGGVTLCAAPITGLLLAVGEPMAVVVLGEPWRGAGIAVVAMSGLGLGEAFASVSEEAIKGCGRTSLINRFTATELVLGLGLLVLVIPWGLVGVGLAISADRAGGRGAVRRHREEGHRGRAPRRAGRPSCRRWPRPQRRLRRPPSRVSCSIPTAARWSSAWRCSSSTA